MVRLGYCDCRAEARLRPERPPHDSPMTPSELIAAARRARDHARADFSHFQVGAALEGASGTIHSGCNIENATYGLTVCAERVAVFKAVSEGESKFPRIAIVADTPILTPPCGACRQILWEFCGDIEIILANLQGQTETLRLSSLFPRPFDVAFLEK